MKNKRETLDESTVTIDGKTKTLREHLTATEGKADGAEYDAESARFLGALPRVIPRRKIPPTKPKAIYSRKLSSAEIAEEEVKLMASQSLKSLKFLLNHPHEWYTAKQVCEGIGEEPRTASPTVSRLVNFFQEVEPDTLKVRQVGRAREMMLKAVADDVDEWSQKYNDQYLVWLAEHTKTQREIRLGKGKWPRKIKGKLDEQVEERREQKAREKLKQLEKGKTAEEIEAGMRSFLPGEKLTIEIKGSIKILFGFVK